MNKIDSLQNDYIKLLSKLNNKKNIEANGIFIIEGDNLIREAASKNKIDRLLVTSYDMYYDLNVEKIMVTEEIISKVSANVSNPGAIGVCRTESYPEDLTLFEKIIVLDGINDPGNLGTIIRTANAFNFDAVVTLNNSVYRYNPKVVRSTQGSIFDVPIVELHDFDQLNEFDVYKFIIDDKAKKLEDITIDNKKFALIFGNEANGISNKIINDIDGENIFIDIDNIDSLNVAISAGIAMNKLKS